MGEADRLHAALYQKRKAFLKWRQSRTGKYRNRTFYQKHKQVTGKTDYNQR